MGERSMRVIAGVARSMPLAAPAGLDTRPTTDRIKETLFNMLQNEIPGCVFVDFFSGSGAIGIEALSRGAHKAYFIENAPKAANCIRENLIFTKLQDHAILLKQDACAAVGSILEKEVDVIFMDPPYGQDLEKNVLSLLSGARYVTSDTLIIVETAINENISSFEDLGYDIVKIKKYKTNQHVFLRLNTK